MNYINLALWIGGGLGPVILACAFQDKITTGMTRFIAFAAVGAGFAILNVGPLGAIIGGPSILMSAGLCAYLTRKNV